MSDKCASCSESLSIVSFQHCSHCKAYVHGGTCSALISLLPESQPFLDVQVDQPRVALCKPCMLVEFDRRFLAQEKGGVVFVTPGTELSLAMKATILGVEQLFNFLGLKAGASPEDYRRDREQMVFQQMKKLPVFLGGSGDEGGQLSVETVLAATPDDAESETKGPPCDLTVLTRVESPKSDLVVLMFHGGAFVMGDHDTPMALRLLQRIVLNLGCIGVSGGYRKAPEHQFPAWIEDGQGALEWVRNRYAGARIIVMGDSAGANVAASLMHSCRTLIAGALLLNPILDLAEFDTDSWKQLGAKDQHLLLNRELAVEQCGHLFQNPDDAKLPLASPLRDSKLDGLPRIHVMCGAFDPLLDDSRNYVAKCREADIIATLTIYSTAPHGWIGFPQTSPEQEEAIHEIIAFLDRVYNRIGVQ